MDQKPPLHVLLAGPRGCCAGVDRAIQVVEEALRRYGAPVYVRHEIVHNRTVVEQLKAQGAVFVEELDEVPAEAQVGSDRTLTYREQKWENRPQAAPGPPRLRGLGRSR